MKKLYKIYESIKELYLNIFNNITAPTTVKVIGIGGGGSNIVEYIESLNNSNINNSNIRSLIINSDVKALQSKKVPNKIQLYTVDGYGCGSNDKCGLMLIDTEVLDKIKKFIDKSKEVNIIVTLGGGVGSGSTQAIIKYLYQIDIKVNFFVVYPFSWEGIKRTNRAKKTVEFVKNYCYNIYEFYNDNLKQYGNISMHNSFNILNNDIYNLINSKNNN